METYLLILAAVCWGSVGLGYYRGCRSAGAPASDLILARLVVMAFWPIPVCVYFGRRVGAAIWTIKEE